MEPQSHLFSLRQGTHYLNCAYKAPLLKSAEAAALQALERERNPQDYNSQSFFEGVGDARDLFAGLVHCHPSQVALISSVSYGLASVFRNVPYRKGQHAIVVDKEFPSGYMAVKRWCDAHGAELITIKPDSVESIGENWNAKLLESINADTAVVMLSSVHWMNGLKFNLERIGQRCREVGAKFVVDGTQSVGAMHMDVMRYNIDALVCAGYKWLLGPYSIGMAYMSETFNDGTPLEETWMNRTNAQDFSHLTDYDPVYQLGASRYSIGESSQFILLPMLLEGLKQVSKWTPEGVQAHAQELVMPLLRYMEDVGIAVENQAYRSNHIIGVEMPEGTDAEAVRQNLARNNIYVSVRGTALRVAINAFNDADDVQALLRVLENAG